MKTARLDFILLANVAATAVMTGVIWFVQVVHYPLFVLVGEQGFANYEQQHRALTTWVVGPPMLVEALTAGLLVIYAPPYAKRWQLVAGLILIAVLWASTALIQVPCHETLSHQFERAVAERLVASNWLRTVAWTLRSVLMLQLVRQRLR
ncbi:MAG: hypothetical protein RIS70_567 [Planctomycetota bacterium]